MSSKRTFHKFAFEWKGRRSGTYRNDGENLLHKVFADGSVVEREVRHEGRRIATFVIVARPRETGVPIVICGWKVRGKWCNQVHFLKVNLRNLNFIWPNQKNHSRTV